ncbi:MAG TPA: S8 family serine peptidase, partial [Blastocatellia bacterium]|nr:S8 family serine peptidase [Blastocatellia bacterium]
MKIRIVLLAVALATVGSGCLGSSSANNNAALIKIAPQVLEQTAGGRKTEFLVVLSDQADLTLADSFKTKREKGEYVYRALLEKAGSTQPAIIEWLSTRAIPHQSFYIVNAILVNASADVAAELAQREDVARIEANSLIANNPELPVAESSPRPRLMSVEGNLSFIHAPEVWSLGYTGQGIVVGAGDTGQRYDHQALRDHYRGFTGSSFNHDYNWHDSIHSPATGGDCGADSPVPCDDSGHGSHTIGTAVGDDGAGNQIGVAPGAKWIGCRNMDRGNGTPARYLECFQFFLAPYPVGGNPAQGDPSRAADVTTNSWGCPQSEGCSANTLLAGVAAQRSAGVLTVVSAGNSGPGCSTVSDPPAIYNQSYTVGAFSHVTGTIATFSSRGPVTADGSGRLKPDISAPGVSIRSSTNTAANAYASLSGTSMAAPHVAGAIALLLSARPDLRGRVDDIEGYLNETAVKV